MATGKKLIAKEVDSKQGCVAHLVSKSFGAVVMSAERERLHWAARATSVTLGLQWTSLMLASVRKAVVLEPHPDDLAIGCGGLVQKLVAQGAEVHALLLSAMPPKYRKIYDESGKYTEYGGDIRMAEAAEAARILGITSRSVAFGHEWHHKLDAMPRHELVSTIEHYVRAKQPELVLVPERSFNQDHIAVFEAFQTVMRPHFYRDMVLAYETTMEREFEPNVIVPLTPSQFERKLQACKAFRTQLGTANHLFSLETMELSMRYRGRLAYSDAAEAFRLVRGVFH